MMIKKKCFCSLLVNPKNLFLKTIKITNEKKSRKNMYIDNIYHESPIPSFRFNKITMFLLNFKKLGEKSIC